MPEQNGDLSSMLQKLLSDPQMLGRAMEMAGKLKDSGLLDGAIARAGGSEDVRAGASASDVGAYRRREDAYIEDDGKSKAAGRTPLGGMQDALRGGSEDVAAKQRKELLTAIRPFLGRERQERIDGILKILQLLELLKTAGAAGVFPSL